MAQWDNNAFMAGLLGGFVNTSSRVLLERENRRYTATSTLVENVIKSGDVDAYDGLTPTIKKLYGNDFVDSGRQAVQRNRNLLDQAEEFRKTMLSDIIERNTTQPDYSTAPGPAQPTPTPGFTPDAAVAAPATSLLAQAVDSGVPGGAEPPVMDRRSFGIMPADAQAAGVEGSPLTGISPDQSTGTFANGRQAPVMTLEATEQPPQTYGAEAGPAVALGPTRTTAPPSATNGAAAPATTAITQPPPRSEVRPGATVPLPPEDKAASAWLVKNFSGQRGLKPGMSVTIPFEKGGLGQSTGSITINGSDTLADRTRKVMAAGEKIGATPGAIGQALGELGLPVSEEAIKMYGERQATNTYKALVPSIAQELGVDQQNPAAQRAAAYETFKRTGYLSPRLDKLAFPTAEDRAREVDALVRQQIADGQPVETVIKNADRGRLGLTDDAKTSIRQEYMGNVYKQAIAANPNDVEGALSLAQAAVNYDPKAIKGFAETIQAANPPLETTAGTKEELAKGGAATQRRPSGADITAAQQRADTRAVQQAGNEASARTTATRLAEVKTPERLPNTQQEAYTKVQNVLGSAKAVIQDFNPDAFGLGQENLGAFLEKVGGKTPEESKFRANVNALKNAVVAAEAGLSQTTTEVANQRLVVPLLGLPAKAAIPRLVALFEDQRRRALNIVQNAREQNYVLPNTKDLENFDALNTLRQNRFNQLSKTGLDKAAIYQQMREEGY